VAAHQNELKQRVSIVIPFFNEEENVEPVVTGLLAALTGGDFDVDLVCVQNGSRDRTGEILARLGQTNPRITIVNIATNRGYGFGVRQGLTTATGTIIGYSDGDGQAQPADVIRVLGSMRTHRAAKAIRIIRNDGWQRRFVSAIFNALFHFLFRVRPRDANAKPKFFHKEDLTKLALESDDFFIDTEVMIKVEALGITWAEEPIEFCKRVGGASSVRLSSIMEFLYNLLRWRFGQGYRTWKRTTLPSQSSTAGPGQS